jgi:nitric oxide reductase NorE protein
MSSSAEALALPHAAAPPRLRGDLALWFVIGAELLTFGLLFVAYAFARARETALFDAAQATLDVGAGALNTVWLVSGSWCVARAVRALHGDDARRGRRWLLAALACAAAFLLSKSVELDGKFDAGIDLTTNTFWMFYLMLTVFHFLHVAVAAVFLAVVAWHAGRGAYGAQRLNTPESAAAFWHMVDLLWIVLFPLLYVMH